MNIQLVRTPVWRWSLCFVLLLATLLLYMDRLTIAQLAKDIKTEFSLNEQEYGALDAAFSIAFALGALVIGFVSDRWNVWWLYPAIVFAWSLAGTMTGLVPAGSYLALLACRFWLGLAEAGHWPCALRTTQRLFTPDQRTLANSILQSGAAVGAVLTPLVIIVLLIWADSWRYPFIIIGSFGLLWVAIWFLMVRRQDMAPPTPPPASPWTGLWDEFLRPLLTDRRFYVLIFFAICLNNTWHFFRVWLPRLLDNTYGFDRYEIQYFTSAFYVAADVGSLAIGFGSLWLVRRGMSVHGSRMTVLTLCAVICTASLALTILPSGFLAQTAILLVGFGALGLFSPYYSLTQEISNRHQGKVTGLFGCLIWLAMAPQRLLEGAFADLTDNYNFGLTVAGVSPVIGVTVLWLFWPTKTRTAPPIPLPHEMETGIMDRGAVVGVREMQTGIAELGRFKPPDIPSPPPVKE